MAATGERNPAVTAVAVPPALLALLPGTGFADCYRVGLRGHRPAPELAEMLFSHAPAWFRPLMAARDRIMAVAGVRPAGGGPFPVVSRDDRQVVLGYDDSHLDFRLVAQVSPAGAGPAEFSLTTLVRCHNRLGRAYLCAVLPFHRRIARTTLSRLGRLPPP